MTLNVVCNIPRRNPFQITNIYVHESFQFLGDISVLIIYIHIYTRLTRCAFLLTKYSIQYTIYISTLTSFKHASLLSVDSVFAYLSECVHTLQTAIYIKLPFLFHMCSAHVKHIKATLAHILLIWDVLACFHAFVKCQKTSLASLPINLRKL